MIDMGKAMRGKVEQGVKDAPKLGLRGVEWDCSLTLIPTPQGPQPVYMALIQVSSMILGKKVSGIAIIGDLNSDQPEVTRVLTQTFSNLRNEYDKSGAINNGQGPQGGLQHG